MATVTLKKATTQDKIIDLKNPEESLLDPLAGLLHTGAGKLIADAVEEELQRQSNNYTDFKYNYGQHRRLFFQTPHLTISPARSVIIYRFFLTLK
ncbi:MAG: hypothetical protein ACL93V_03985 [Candidatus Electrothrix sp. YB6]